MTWKKRPRVHDHGRREGVVDVWRTRTDGSAHDESLRAERHASRRPRSRRRPERVGRGERDRGGGWWRSTSRASSRWSRQPRPLLHELMRIPVTTSWAQSTSSVSKQGEVGRRASRSSELPSTAERRVARRGVAQRRRGGAGAVRVVGGLRVGGDGRLVRPRPPCANWCIAGLFRSLADRYAVTLATCNDGAEAGAEALVIDDARAKGSLGPRSGWVPATFAKETVATRVPSTSNSHASYSASTEDVNDVARWVREDATLRDRAVEVGDRAELRRGVPLEVTPSVAATVVPDALKKPSWAVELASGRLAVFATATPVIGRSA